MFINLLLFDGYDHECCAFAQVLIYVCAVRSSRANRVGNNKNKKAKVYFCHIGDPAVRWMT